MDPVTFTLTNPDLDFWRAIVLATLTENDDIWTAIQNADSAVFVMRHRQLQGISSTVAGINEKAQPGKTP